MTSGPKTIGLSDLAYNALIIMQKTFSISVLPVLDGEKVVGLLRLHDLIKAGL